MEKNSIAFNVPFCGFAGTTFINCFASTYMFLESVPVGGSDYDCRQAEGKPCNSCGNCGKGGSTPIREQEKYFFLFDTVCGRSSLRCRFDGAPTEMEKLICEIDFYDGGTDDNVDFLFGFAGYEYAKLTELGEFREAIVSSIDSGRPVIGKVREGKARFRVITGYDGESLICPDFTNAQKKPKEAPAYAELEALYIIGQKTAPRHTFRDGLERIIKVMEYNIGEKLWSGYTEKMGLYTSDSLGKVGIEEKKARMKRVAQTMWHTFNCHNFAEVFRNRQCKELRDPALKQMCKTLGHCHGYTHDLAWALIGLEKCADWSIHAANYFGEMVELTLDQIAKNDERVLEIIKQILEIIH